MSYGEQGIESRLARLEQRVADLDMRVRTLDVAVPGLLTNVVTLTERVENLRVDVAEYRKEILEMLRMRDAGQTKNKEIRVAIWAIAVTVFCALVVAATTILTHAH